MWAADVCRPQSIGVIPYTMWFIESTLMFCTLNHLMFFDALVFDTVSNVLLKKNDISITPKLPWFCPLVLLSLYSTSISWQIPNFGRNFRQVDLSQLKFKDRDILQDGPVFFFPKVDYFNFWQKKLGGITAMVSWKFLKCMSQFLWDPGKVRLRRNYLVQGIRMIDM